MIEPVEGSILAADAEALVNTVNCVGVMGKGIALLFKERYPENFSQYEKACSSGELQPGRMFVVPTGRLMNPRYIVNFPTKRHWKGKSRMEDIQAGLEALVEEVRKLSLQSIAVPALGCGNGGLEWSEVRPLIEAAFSELSDVRVLLFAPMHAIYQERSSTPVQGSTKRLGPRRTRKSPRTSF
jgi:O-acetyl-ADP-ribose deacetylase (regulator of RNase III)